MTDTVIEKPRVAALASDGDSGDIGNDLAAPAAPSASNHKYVGVSALALGVAACGGGGGDGAAAGGGAAPVSGGTSGGTAPPPVARPQSDQEAARFVLQTSIAASPAEITAVQDQGYAPWLDSQLSAGIGQTGIQWMEATGYSRVDENNWYFRRDPGDYMIWNQLMSGGGEVRKRAALALSEFFVVSLNGINLAWRSQAIAKYWDILAEHAFGNFRDLLEDITLNPAMGVWLNTRGNRRGDPRTGRAPDENYAREVMQLFTIGLLELNADGTVRTDGSGNAIETYTNEDVTELAKVFTGYDFDHSRSTELALEGETFTIPSIEYILDPMTADPSRWRFPRGEGFHSEEAKTFLGTTIPAGTNATDSLRIALDALFNHPNVAPFFAQQMIQRLVTSNPSPAYVQRVASVFDNNGSGTRGDLRAVFRAIWLDDEALSADGLASTTFGKLREPILRLAQWARTFGATSESGGWTVRDTADASSRLGQSPLRSPSVFNFFRPGYVPSNSNIGNNGLVAPEFQLLNESSAPGYINFMTRVIEDRQFVTNDLQTSYTNEVALAEDPAALIDRLNLLMTAGQLSEGTISTIRAALDARGITATSSDEDKLRQVHTAIMLVMASPDYLVQK
ncbi:DUF1800 domain-containing protein [Qipengyuania sp. DGS5-3]|uniref:DUF1800 domain-containing protein n=1 Tax=Qipengyuania sp. DGS5-3 TaxID=3349632 RepID=UPI0036D42522